MGHRRVSTARLILTALAEDDIDEMHRLHADPRVWTHLPTGVHTSRTETVERLTSSFAAWGEHGLGYWTVRERSGAFVGIGGCSVVDQVRWNLYYRIDPEFQGRGYATEVARAGLDAAAAVHPDLPRTAFLLEQNVGSERVAARCGLSLRWRGPDVGNPDPDAVRLVYADRPLSEAQLAVLTG